MFGLGLSVISNDTAPGAGAGHPKGYYQDPTETYYYVSPNGSQYYHQPEV